jgi:hypothetical protein
VWLGSNLNDRPGLVRVGVQAPLLLHAVQLVAVMGARCAGALSVIVYGPRPLTLMDLGGGGGVVW